MEQTKRGTLIKKVCIVSLGWLGSALYKKLMTTTYEVVGSYFQNPKTEARSFQYDFNHDSIPDQIKTSDIIVFNLPPSKINSNKQFEAFVTMLKDKRILFISSTSVYGDQGIVNEQSEPIPNSPNGEYLKELESILKKNHNDFLIIRPGGLYGKDRHPGKYLAGKKDITGGLSPINLTGQEDLVSIIVKNLSDSPTSLINAVNFHHPLKQDYYLSYAQKNNLPAPSFLEEKSSNKIITTQYKEFEIKSPLP